LILASIAIVDHVLPFRCQAGVDTSAVWFDQAGEDDVTFMEDIRPIRRPCS